MDDARRVPARNMPRGPCESILADSNATPRG